MNIIMNLMFLLFLFFFGMISYLGLTLIKRDHRIEKIILHDLDKEKGFIFKHQFGRYDIHDFPQALIFLKENLSSRAFQDIELLFNKKFKVKKIQEQKDGAIYEVNDELVKYNRLNTIMDLVEDNIQN